MLESNQPASPLPFTPVSTPVVDGFEPSLGSVCSADTLSRA